MEPRVLSRLRGILRGADPADRHRHLTLDLPQELERELAAEAARLGLPLEQYALRLLSKSAGEGDGPRNGAELVEYWRRERLVGYRSGIADSASHARSLRREAERRPAD